MIIKAYSRQAIVDQNFNNVDAWDITQSTGYQIIGGTGLTYSGGSGFVTAFQNIEPNTIYNVKLRVPVSPLVPIRVELGGVIQLLSVVNGFAYGQIRSGTGTTFGIGAIPSNNNPFTVSYVELIPFPFETVLDVEDLDPVSLTLSIADIREPEKRKTSHSKTIKLPGTKNNNKFFKSAYEISGDAEFDPRRSVRCVVEDKGTTLFEGKLQLLSITRVGSGTNRNLNNVVYECVIVSKQADLFGKLDGKLVKDLDWWSYNHTRTIPNIIKTGWTFPSVFDPLNPDFVDSSVSVWGVDTNNVFQGSLFTGTISTYTDSEGSWVKVSGPIHGYTAEDSLLVFRPFEYNSASGVFYGGNLSGTCEIREILNTTEFVIAQRIDGLINYNPGETVKYMEYYPFGWGYTYLYGDNGFTNAGQGSSNATSDTAIITYNSNGSQQIATTVESAALFFNRLRPSVYIREIFEKAFKAAGLKWNSVFLDSKLFRRLILQHTGYGDTTLYTNINQPINIADVISKDLKVTEVLADIVKMFNLYIDTDPDDLTGRTLLVEPRDEFYNLNKIVDWTEKLATNEDVVIKPFSEFSSPNFTFEFSDKADTLSTFQEQVTGFGLGQQNIIDDQNDTADKPVNVKVTGGLIDYVHMKYPSIVYNGNSYSAYPLLPRLSSDEWQPTQAKARYGIAARKKAFNVPVCLKSEVSLVGVKPSYLIPFAGRNDNPYSPSYELGFGIHGAMRQLTATPPLPATGGYPESDNTLFNYYWSNTIAEFADRTSKLVTMSMHLTPADIAGIDFRKTYFVDTHSFRLNKINNFTGIGLTQVEFSWIYLNPTKRKVVKNLIIERPDLNSSNLNQDIADYSQTTNSDNITLLGDNTNTNTVIASDNINILGGGNTVTNSENTTVIGSGNVLNNTDASYVVGTDNTVNANIDNVYVFGDNITATSSNTLYTNNLDIATGGTLNGVPIEDILNIINNTNMATKIVPLGTGWNITFPLPQTFNFAHGLTGATEWETITNVRMNILNDTQTANFEATGFSFVRADSGNIIMELTTNDWLANPAFDSTTVNRGYIVFDYKPA